MKIHFKFVIQFITMYGIADSKFVITVAYQYDICPQGKT